MQEGEQPTQAQPFEGMSGPGQQDQDQHLKTIAVRVDESLHAQLRFIAQLNGSSITEELRRAIEARIASAQDDPELIARAEQAREAIEREAAARSAAIAGFLGKPALTAAADPSPKTRRSRSTSE